MWMARSSRGARASVASAPSSAVESAPPLKATHTETCGKSGRSSARRALSARGPNATLRRPPARLTASGRGFGKYAERGDLGGARSAQLLGRDRRELVQIADDDRLEARGDRRRIAMRAPERLLDGFVDEAELVQAVGGEIQRVGGHFLLVLALPEDRGAALGRDHRIGAVLEHQQAVAHSDAERAAGSARPGPPSDDGNAQLRHHAAA